MTKKVVTNDGKKGGWLVGKRHYDKQGKSLGGIKAVVTDAGDKPVELETGEVIINREASKKYWKELSKINQSAGNGVPIEPPTDAFDEDPAEDYENGGKIEFNANHIPNKWILNYAIKIKEEHPDVWALGGNIFGNQAFVNLKRVAERGHWLDSEEWMYKKWRAFVARHQGDFRIQGVIAMLKWVDKVDKGWQYMKNLIEEEIKKREARKSKKMNDGGKIPEIKEKYSVVVKISSIEAPNDVKSKGTKNKYLGSYKKIFDILNEDSVFAETYALDDVLVGNDLYVFFENNFEPNKYDKISKLKNVKIIESNTMNDGGNVDTYNKGDVWRINSVDYYFDESYIDNNGVKKWKTYKVFSTSRDKYTGTKSIILSKTITDKRLKEFADVGKKYGMDVTDLFVIKYNDGGNLSKTPAPASNKMETGGGISNTNAEKFMQWFIEWYKPISDAINITFSLPNELLPFKEKNVVILDLFEKKNQNIDAKKYLHEIVKKADELGVIIYLEPKPRHKYFLNNEAKKKKITPEYLVDYYKNFGFNVTINKKFMKRLPQMNNGGNLSKTPAPAAERIKGSKFNASGSAKDSKSGASIKFDDNTVASIQSLISTHNEKYPSKKITLGVAKAVVRRGMGAYSGTHRPTITGGKPNSRTAWGLARLKAFIYKAEKGNSKSGKYSQDNDLFDDLGIKVSKFDKGGEIEKVKSTKELISLVSIEREKLIKDWYARGEKVVVGRNDGYWYDIPGQSDAMFIASRNPNQRKVLQIIKENPEVTEIHFQGAIKVGAKVGYELEIVDDFDVVLWKKDSEMLREGMTFEFTYDNGKYINTIVNKNETIYKDRQSEDKYVYFKQEDKKYKSISDVRSKREFLQDDFESGEAVFVNKYENGGDVRGMSWYSDFKKQQLKKGTEHELEHSDTIEKFKKEGVSDREVAAQIAKDHLDENENYYIELEKMEGKKFQTGGLITEKGGEAKVGDKGILETRNGNIPILITGITDKKVRFKIISDNNRLDSNPVERFVRNYRGEATAYQTTTPTPTPTPTTTTTTTTTASPSKSSTSEWRVKTLDELKSQGLFKNDEYRGISDYTINKWGGKKVVSVDSKAISSLESGKNNFTFMGYGIGRELFTEDPLPSTQSKVVHELANYRIRTEQEFINEYGKNWQKQVGWLSGSGNMDWLFGEKITDIVTTDRYDTILKLVKNGNRFESDFSTKNIIDVYWTITPYMYMFDPALYSENAATNLGQTQQKDLRPSTDKDVLDATFNVGDVVYIRKDKTDFLGIDFDSNDNVFKIVTEKFEPTAKRPQNKTGKSYRIEQLRPIAVKRIFELEGKDIAIFDNNQTKPKEFGNYILKKNVTKDDFEGIKIIVSTPEKSEAFQKLMFSLGIDWNNGDGTLKALPEQRLSVSRYSTGFLISYIKESDFDGRTLLKEIKFDDLFELKGQAKPALSQESLKELFKDVKEIDKEREQLEATPLKNETQINDELKALEDEYNDLLFLIDMTPSTDVDNMLSLKLQAKQLKDKIDLLHLDLKKKIDGELKLLDNLFNASAVKPQERYQFNAYNDGFAPDGQPTSLPKNLYDWTMTQEFQNWFGNFTNAYNYRNSSYENVPCSVVVNKHYEPLVVYHGTGAEFSFFKFDKFPAMYFAENEAYSNWFAEIKGQQSGTSGYVYPFLLNIRTPLDLTIYGIDPVSPDNFIDWMFLQTGLDAEELKISKALLDPSQKFQAWRYLRNSPEMLNVLRDKAVCDGIIYYEDNPSVDKSSDAYQTKAYIVFNSNSAKIADPNREMMTIPAMRSFYLKRGGKL